MIFLSAVVALEIASASNLCVPSADIVPRGSWVYDALISLASDDLLEGYPARLFQGERLLNRLEVAGILGQAIESDVIREANPSQIALFGRLVEEFEPELKSFHGSNLERWKSEATRVETNTPLVAGYGRLVIREDDGSNDSVTIPYRVSVLGELSREAFGAMSLSRREERFFLRESNEPAVSKILITGFGSNSVWEVGRDYHWFGPAYGGSLILSDNSGGFWGVGESREFNWGPFLGRVKVSQFATAFEDAGERLYLFARRYQRPITHGWFLGVSETAKTTKVPNPLILVMPYYLYQHIFNEVDEEFNALYSADFLYNGRTGYEVYGELLIDDVTAPRLFGGGFDRPRKTGWTLGLYLPKFVKHAEYSTLRVEYTSIDRLTYSATRPLFSQLAYTHNGEIIGHPIGPNARSLYLRSEHSFGDKFSLITEYLDQREKESREPRGVERKTLSLLFCYDICTDRSIEVRVAPYEMSGTGGAKDSGTLLEVRATASF